MERSRSRFGFVMEENDEDNQLATNSLDDLVQSQHLVSEHDNQPAENHSSAVATNVVGVIDKLNQGAHHRNSLLVTPYISGEASHSDGRQEAGSS